MSSYTYKQQQALREADGIYRFYGHTLEVVNSGKNLGMNISNDLTWHIHVDATVAKASKTQGLNCSYEFKVILVPG